MYETHHSYDDLEEGREVLWNGKRQTVDAIGPHFAVIGGKTLFENDINEMFSSPDVPFELVHEPRVEVAP